MTPKNKTYTTTASYKPEKLKLKKSFRAMSGMLLATLATVGAHAQKTEGELEGITLEEVVVTGTLIRGTEVTGSQTIGVDAQKITEIGAVNTNEVLASVPQITNFFNDRPEVEPRASANLVVSRPNLRNMPGLNSSTSAVTLVLMDGHRIAPVGVQAAIVDADIILGNTLERVDIVTDGGSSLYGADAVAGVINFVTKDKADGVKIDLDYGAADDMNTVNVNLSAGTSWDTGSIYVAATQSNRDGLRTEDRDWAKIGTYDDDGNFVKAGESARTECLVPVRSQYGWYNYGAGWTDNPAAPGAGPKSAGDPTCDHYAQSTLLPEQERKGLFLSYQQEMNDSVQFGVKAYYSQRENTFFSYPLGSSAPGSFDVTTNPGTLTPAEIAQFQDPNNPNVVNYPAGAGFSYGAHPAYPDSDQEVEMSTWGVAPTLTIAMGKDWQLRNTLYYGRSYNKNVIPEVNDQRMVAAVNSGQLDPLNVASADADVINNILNWETKKETIHELFLARVVADGPVIELPAGDLRVAAGFEVAEDRVRTRFGTGNRGSLSDTDYARASRDNTSVFAEVHVPVLDNLELSASVRHDDYSDFGKTTNPQFGFSYTPTDWLRVYGHWGESFNAPTTLDTLAFSTGRAANQTVQQIQDADVYGEWNGQGTYTVPTEGTKPGVQPQTATSWALGFDMEPIEGLMIKANYYEIDFQDILGGLSVPSEQIRRDFPDKFIWHPTKDEWAQYLTEIQNPEVFDGIIDPNDPNATLAYIFDRRVTNFGEATMKGVDFGVQYVHDTSFGTMDYGITGNHQIEFELTEGGVTSDSLEFASDLTAQGSVGWSRDNVRAKLTVNYTDGFEADNASNQSKVDAFIVTNLFFGYEFQGSGFTEGLSLRFNIDNVFDEDPSEYRYNDTNEDKYSSFTLGRMYKVGISKTFN
ncbi:TonB-dependent receptor domain-containing protein [Pseudomaricurvus sp.]|uniref:TonB-dependent receptor domain-containing protein n=1 Tax=Pseudomaricurvus sp. TaxID=2004510 RepID=UPI003F6C3886